MKAEQTKRTVLSLCGPIEEGTHPFMSPAAEEENVAYKLLCKTQKTLHKKTGTHTADTRHQPGPAFRSNCHSTNELFTKGVVCIYE